MRSTQAMFPLASSFRDPSGFVFSHNERVYRQVNNVFSDEFDAFMSSGLYEELLAKGLLISHDEVMDESIPRTTACYKLIEPLQIPFISYPYEWSFSQFKDAAMVTLRAQAVALKYGYTLKDASAYNVQFNGYCPVLIDTLSFVRHVQNTPWVAYQQFCQHFLAPLALAAHADIGLGKLMMSHIDGIPLSLASRLLPMKTRMNYGLLVHVHLHAKLQMTYADMGGEGARKVKKVKRRTAKVSRRRLKAIVESLASTVQKLEWKPDKTEWGSYYSSTNYSEKAAEDKKKLVAQYLMNIDSPLNIIQDLGANTGLYSRVAAPHCKLVVSQDMDPVAVERNYLAAKELKLPNLLPLVQNLSEPSPAIGWANEERDSFRQRAKCDVVLALAIVHHLAISGNVPLDKIARFLASLGKWLVIEFVPKSDSQVVRLLETRDDIFLDYTKDGFETAFRQYFSFVERQQVSGSLRTLYLLKNTNG